MTSTSLKTNQQVHKPLLHWFKNLKEEEKEEFQKLLFLNKQIFIKYLSIIEDMESEIEKTELTINDFENPSWSHKQAFRNGQRSQLKKFKEILNFVQQ